MTDESVTLREYVQSQFRSVEVQFSSMRSMLDERYATQTKALDAAFVAAEKAVQTALASAEKAVAKAENAYEARFALMNEFRQQLNDQAQTFMPRKEAEASIQRNGDRIQELTDRMNTQEGRSGGITQSRALLFAVLTIIIAAVGVALIIISK